MIAILLLPSKFPIRTFIPVVCGPMESKNLVKLLAKSVLAVPGRREGMSVYPMHVTPFSVLYTSPALVVSTLPPVKQFGKKESVPRLE